MEAMFSNVQVYWLRTHFVGANTHRDAESRWFTDWYTALCTRHNNVHYLWHSANVETLFPRLEHSDRMLLTLSNPLLDDASIPTKRQYNAADDRPSPGTSKCISSAWFDHRASQQRPSRHVYCPRSLIGSDDPLTETVLSVNEPLPPDRWTDNIASRSNNAWTSLSFSYDKTCTSIGIHTADLLQFNGLYDQTVMYTSYKFQRSLSGLPVTQAIAASRSTTRVSRPQPSPWTAVSDRVRPRSAWIHCLRWRNRSDHWPSQRRVSPRRR